MNEGREFLKDTVRQRTDFSRTAQSRGLPPPAVQKPAAEGSVVIGLAPPEKLEGVEERRLVDAIGSRRSRRRYLDDPVGLDELSFLLWATQGVRQAHSAAAVFRTVPSAGCRHAFETYIVSLRIAGLKEGIYRYLPLDHALCLEREETDLAARVTAAALGQRFAGAAAAVFIWTALPCRMEWRYGEASYKVIALDAGHVCQNLYLACEAVGAGTCAVAAYDQRAMDNLLDVDGEEEFTVYLAPVGRVTAAGP